MSDIEKRIDEIETTLIDGYYSLIELEEVLGIDSDGVNELLSIVHIEKIGTAYFYKNSDEIREHLKSMLDLKENF